MDTSPLPDPLIVAFVSDLLFTTKIYNVARALGYSVEWVESADSLGKEEPSIMHQPGESLAGRQGRLAHMLAQQQPALLIFDLGNASIPWDEWIPVIKSSPALRRMPVLCYGSHVDSGTLRRARDSGADLVVARSRFSSALPTLITELARKHDRVAIDNACRQPLADSAEKGIQLMNAGEYYQAHEELELAWLEDDGPGRDLYRGILQIAVAYLQIERANYRGAIKMLLRVRQWLDPLPDICRTVDVVRLKEDADRLHDELARLGPDNIQAFDWSLFRAVKTIPDT